MTSQNNSMESGAARARARERADLHAAYVAAMERVAELRAALQEIVWRDEAYPRTCGCPGVARAALEKDAQ